MRGSRNFHERGSNENGKPPKNPEITFFLGKIFKFQGGSGPPPPPPPLWIRTWTLLLSQQAHDVRMTSDRRRCDVILTSCARWDYVIACRPTYSCCLLHFLHLFRLSFIIGMPNLYRSCILELRANQCLVCNFLRMLRCKSQIAPKKTQSLGCFRRNFRNMLTPFQVVSNSTSKVFGGLNLFQCLLMKRVVNVHSLTGLPFSFLMPCSNM